MVDRWRLAAGPRLVRLYEERLLLDALSQGSHLCVIGTLLEPAGRVQDPGQQIHVAHAVEEDPWPREHPPYGEIDVRLRLQWLVPGAVGPRPAQPWPQGNRLDRLHGHLALTADLHHRLEVLRVVGQLHGEVVAGQQDGVEVEAAQAATDGGGDLDTVAGDTDPAHEALLSCLDGRIYRAAGAEGGVPFDRIGQAVELPQVYVVDPQAVERPVELSAGGLRGPGAGLGGQKEPVRVGFEPRPQSQLGIAVTGRDVEMVDAVPQEHVERPIGGVL